ALLATAFRGAAFLATVFFGAAFFGAAFFATAFFDTVFFAATFLATGFFETALAALAARFDTPVRALVAAFFVAVFFVATRLVAAFLVAAFLVAVLPARAVAARGVSDLSGAFFAGAFFAGAFRVGAFFAGAFTGVLVGAALAFVRALDVLVRGALRVAMLASVLGVPRRLAWVACRRGERARQPRRGFSSSARNTWPRRGSIASMKITPNTAPDGCALWLIRSPPLWSIHRL